MPSGVMELQHGRHAARLDSLRQARQPRNEAVLGDEQGARVAEAARFDGDVFHHHHPRPRVGHLGIVIEHETIHLVIRVRIREVHGEADDAIREVQGPETKRREERVRHEQVTPYPNRPNISSTPGLRLLQAAARVKGT